MAPKFSLLVGVWFGGNARLFRTNETSVVEISFFDPCTFVGSGSDVARYATTPLIKPVFDKAGMSLDEAVLLATHALRVAKQNDVFCGGWSDFAVLYDDGNVSSVARSEIAATEHYSETFEEIIRTLFYSVADVDSRLAKGVIELSNKKLARIKREQAKLISERRRIADLLKPQKG